MNGTSRSSEPEWCLPRSGAVPHNRPSVERHSRCRRVQTWLRRFPQQMAIPTQCHVHLENLRSRRPSMPGPHRMEATLPSRARPGPSATMKHSSASNSSRATNRPATVGRRAENWMSQPQTVRPMRQDSSGDVDGGQEPGHSQCRPAIRRPEHRSQKHHEASIDRSDAGDRRATRQSETSFRCEAPLHVSVDRNQRTYESKSPDRRRQQRMLMHQPGLIRNCPESGTYERQFLPSKEPICWQQTPAGMPLLSERKLRKSEVIRPNSSTVLPRCPR